MIILIDLIDRLNWLYLIWFGWRIDWLIGRLMHRLVALMWFWFLYDLFNRLIELNEVFVDSIWFVIKSWLIECFDIWLGSSCFVWLTFWLIKLIDLNELMVLLHLLIGWLRLLVLNDWMIWLIVWLFGLV